MVRPGREPGETGAAAQHVAEHGRSQRAGGHVALAGVVAADQVQRPSPAGIGEQRLAAVPEDRARSGQLPSRFREHRQQGLPGEYAERDDRPQGGPQQLKFSGEPG